MLQLQPKKISNKYKKIRRKRKRARSVEPVEELPKRPKTINNSKNLVMMAPKKIRDKYKNLRYIEKKWTIKKVFKKAKNLFIKLKTDLASVIFAEELLDVRLLKKLKK